MIWDHAPGWLIFAMRFEPARSMLPRAVLGVHVGELDIDLMVKVMVKHNGGALVESSILKVG